MAREMLAADHVYVVTSDRGSHIVIGTDSNGEDVWLPLEQATKLANEIHSRVKEAKRDA